MPILNDIKAMQAEGKTESEIISALKQQGVSPREITEALSQSKIKEAVEAEPVANPMGAQPQGEMAQSIGAQPAPEYAASPAQEAAPQDAYAPQYQQQYAPQQGEAAQYPQYQQYQQPQYQQYQQPAMGGMSPDTITEISEQVVAEKLSPLRKDIERVIDLKTTVESKMELLDERLKRIEKIIDRLQLSIMQKVGEYITNIDDIKKEIVETQKSFKALAPEGLKEKPKKQKDIQEQSE